MSVPTGQSFQTLNRIMPDKSKDNTMLITLNVPPLPTFSGHMDEDFELFQTSLDNYFTLTAMSDEQKVSYVTLLLNGPARTFVTHAPSSERSTYNKLMGLLRKNFGSSATQELHFNSLVTRKQRSKEPLFTYYMDILKHLDACNIKDHNLRRIFFVNGLLPGIREKVIIAHVADIQAAFNLASILNNGSGVTTRAVNAIQTTSTQTPNGPIIGESPLHHNGRGDRQGRPRPRPGVRVCYRCRRRGHEAANCAAP
jgi:hypothetical protein